MKLVTIALALLLTGCASVPYKSPVPHDAARTFSDASDIEAGLTEALEFCAPILSGFESDAYHRAKRAYYLRMSGLLVGSVLVPALAAANAAANAAWIAAGSGYGGSASFAASAYESSGLSGTAPAEVRNSIVRDLTASIAVVTDGSQEMEVRRAALLRVRSSCVVYSITVPTIPAGN